MFQVFIACYMLSVVCCLRLVVGWLLLDFRLVISGGKPALGGHTFIHFNESLLKAAQLNIFSRISAEGGAIHFFGLIFNWFGTDGWKIFGE